jgi:DNA-3-methyladenine glycosylase II
MAWLDEDSHNGDGRTRGEHGTSSGFRDRLKTAVTSLYANDPVLAGLIDRHGPCTLTPSKPQFPVMVETVISQQLSTKAARAIHGRLIRIIGRKAPRPVDILNTRDEDLLAIGFSRSKTRYIKNAALAFQSRELGARSLARMPDDEVMSRLTAVKGIGDWSAHMFLIFALGRLDVFPVGDLGLRNAMAAAYRLRRPPSLTRLNQIGNRWRPYRTIGTWYLWESYDNG